MIKSEFQGVCPKCGSENIEYYHTELEGEFLGYKFECNECGCKATEWYELNFLETTAEE